MPPKRQNALHTVGYALLAAVAFLASILFAIFAVLFFGNFHLPNLWHLFVLIYTLSMPVLTVGSFAVFRSRPTRLTQIAFLAICVLAFFTYFLWAFPASKGLIH